MLDVQTRAPVPGTALARLLARLGGREPVLPAQSPVDQLGDWLDWQQAVVLSRALDDDPARDGADDGLSRPDGTRDECASASPGERVEVLIAECAENRAALEKAIGDDTVDWTVPARPSPGQDRTDVAAGAAAVQRHCQRLQRDMQSATGRLRGELREHLARRGDRQARLAAVDTVMEGLLAPREHALLADVVPALVGRFERLHAHALQFGAYEPASADPGAWRAGFRAEARQVLLAELDLRFHPIQALLSALQNPPADA
jgi:hypothetical protein